MLKLAARGDFADVAVVRVARGFVVDEYAAAAASRPGLQLDGAQIGNEMLADDIEAFIGHPTQVGGVLFGGELVRHFLRDDDFLDHALLP
jgi:hypothetical protein